MNWNQPDSIQPILLSILMLIVVLVLAYLTTKWIGKRGMANSNAKLIKVIDRVVLSPDKSLIIVKAADKTLFLGVTAHHIDKLCELENVEGYLGADVKSSPSVSKILLRALIKSFGWLPDKKDETEDNDS